MKTKNLLILPLLALLLGACSPSIISSSSVTSNTPSSNSSILSSSDIKESSVNTSSSKKEESSASSTSSTSDTSSSSSNSSSSSLNSSSNNPSSSSSNSSSEEETKKDPIPALGEKLPIGNKSVSGPVNKDTPDDIGEWKNYDLMSYLPDNWSYIQGNNKLDHCYDFYANAEGGFKFSHLWYALQTPVFNSWKKVEVRLKISQVQNNSKKRDIDAPIFHIYGYDITGHHIYTDYINQGSITVQSEGHELKFYVKNTDVRYLEFRLNAFPYKGMQCYNFGISQISLKGWDYE